MTRPIIERMLEAKERMIMQNGVRQRVPRVFFLGPEDMLEFERLSPEKMTYSCYQGGFKTEIEVLGLEGVAVRPSKAKPNKYTGKHSSVLYSYSGTTVSVSPK